MYNIYITNSIVQTKQVEFTYLRMSTIKEKGAMNLRELGECLGGVGGKGRNDAIIIFQFKK